MELTLSRRESRLLYIALSKLLSDDETLAYLSTEDEEIPEAELVQEIKRLRARVL